MNKAEWSNFKRNNIRLSWRTNTISWCRDLPFESKFIKFLQKNFSPERIHYKLQKLRFKILKKPAMYCVEYIVTTRCTMNCKHCNTFIPYFTNKTHCAPTSFEQFKQDIDNLLKAIDYIEFFGFVGGEPLISKDLDKMIDYACSKRKIKNVFLATNCTILPSQKLVKSMKNKKFGVQLSDYSNVKNIKNGLTSQYKEFKQILIDNNIKFSHPQEDISEVAFQSMPELYPDKRNDEKMKKMFDNCWGQYCNMICDGILTQCTLSVYISRNMELSEGIKKELVNIREKKPTKQLTEEIISFYAKPYSEFCHYCHNENIQYGLPCGEQLEEGEECKI